MTKRESLRKIARRTQISYETCERIVDLFFDSIHDSLLDGEKFTMRGFGTFEPSVAIATNRYDFRSGEVLSARPSKTVKYRISDNFKRELNKGE